MAEESFIISDSPMAAAPLADDDGIAEEADDDQQGRGVEQEEAGVQIVLQPEPEKSPTKRRNPQTSSGNWVAPCSSEEGLVPARKSRRLQEKGNRREQEERRKRALKLAASERHWKDSEKEQLLNALKLYGSKQWKKVAAHVPTKSEAIVKSYISREKRNQNYTVTRRFVREDGETTVLDTGADNRLDADGRQFRVKEELDGPDPVPSGRVEEELIRRKRNAPIEMWLEMVETYQQQEEARLKAAGFEQACDYSSVVPASLNMIADLEPHPDPESCGGVDYAAIYRYMAALCEGEAPADLDVRSAERVSRLMPQLVSILKEMRLEKETAHLEGYKGLHSAKMYKREPGFQDGAASAKTMANLSRIPGLNPLNLDVEMFVDRKVPFLDET